MGLDWTPGLTVHCALGRSAVASLRWLPAGSPAEAAPAGPAPLYRATLPAPGGGDLDLRVVAREVEAAEAPAGGSDPLPTLVELAFEGRLAPELVERVLAVLLESVAPLLRLDRDAAFAAAVATLAARAAGPAAARATAFPGHRDLLVDFGAAPLACDGAFAVLAGSALAYGRVAGAGGGGRLALLAPARARFPAEFLLIVADGRLAVWRLEETAAEDLGRFVARTTQADPQAPALLARAGSASLAVAVAVAARRQPRPAQPFREDGLDAAVKLSAAVPTAAGLFVDGWLRDPERQVREIRLLGADPRTPDLAAGWHETAGTARIDDRAVAVRRFAVTLPTAGTLPQPEFELVLTDGARARLRAPASPADPAERRSLALAAVDERTLTPDVLDRVFRPVVDALSAEANARQAVRAVEVFGPVVRAPAVSIVVPIYGVTGFIRSQLLAFAADPFLKGRSEILYAVDDPPLAPEVAAIAGGLAPLLGLCVRVVELARNGGYALANNLAAAEARAPALALLNSDVVPLAPGWLQPMLDALKRRRTGVAGARLLYGDGSLQHAGLYFRPYICQTFQNMHYFKGYAGAFPPALRPRRVPAVTGACMVLRRSDFLAVGGFTPAYAIGDYEDSDLCLKLDAAGLDARYVPQAALLHAERQSITRHAGHTAAGASAYNRALHARLWSARIPALMGAAGAAPEV